MLSLPTLTHELRVRGGALVAVSVFTYQEMMSSNAVLLPPAHLKSSVSLHYFAKSEGHMGGNVVVAIVVEGQWSDY